MTIEEHVLLAPYTTFKIGGAARYFALVRNIQEIYEALAFAKERALPFLILGGGSNVLIDDKGFDGVVLKLDITGITKEDTTLVAGAGESWDALVACAVTEGLWGLENLSGIPGSVGGAVVGGIGAYGASVGQHLVWVEALTIGSKELRRFTKEECAFDYRTSFFKQNTGRYVLLRAAFTLTEVPTPRLSYKDVAERMQGVTPTLQAVREAIVAIRAGKFPDLLVEGTAGSFFKNPIMSVAQAHVLKERYPDMPLFAMPETSGVKIPLAWLLDHVLKLKGAVIGNARLFEKQPLVIATNSNAHATDVLQLAEMVEKEVAKEFCITLEREVRVVE